MDSLYRDVMRLGLMSDSFIAQESFSTALRLKDFSSYYLKRFVTNLTHVFDDFTSSEIEDFNHRHARKLAVLYTRPDTLLDKVVVPIPKGMVLSYHQTIDHLTQLLHAVHPEDFITNLQDIFDESKDSSQDQALPNLVFDDCKATIAKLFSPMGVNHALAPDALTSLKVTSGDNNQLIQLVRGYYPQVIALNKFLKKLEQGYIRKEWSQEERERIAHDLTTIAQRLSLFAVVMKHIQEIEHGFVKCLTILLNLIDQ